jgi:hypothetical protein
MFTLPKGKAARNYKITDGEGKEVLNGSLKELKALYSTPAEKFVVVKDFLRKVNKHCTDNGMVLSIEGKSFAETYPKK